MASEEGGGFLPLRSDEEDEHADEETATYRFRVKEGHLLENLKRQDELSLFSFLC